MARASQSGMSITIDTKALAKLGRDLRRASPEAWQAYRASVRKAAEVVLQDAQSRVGYSDIIPQSMKIRVTAGGNVKIVAGGDAAPDAAAIENRGKGFVRHPVFGNRNVWTAKNSHPAFLAPALDANAEMVLQAIEDAVVAAVQAALAE